MVRRDFLKTAAIPALGALSAPSGVLRGAAVSPDLTAAPIMKSYTAAEHRRRLENIGACERAIRGCMRKHLITGYIPGQVSYNLGEYPCRKPYDPDDYDERELDRLHDGGIRLIQVMEDWNDLLRLFGGNKFTAVNPAGLKRFIGMVHRRGMKIILYASTGYMQQGDPDLREEWVRDPHGRMVQGSHWRLVRCSPASPGWRAYLLPRTVGILDEYGCDGLFNDWGYRPLYLKEIPPAKDEVRAFQETPEHDSALEDLVALIHSEVKRRGGIYKMHADNNNRPKTNIQLYDYLWVGEGVFQIDKVRQEAKNHPPYVVPCYDFRNGKPDNKDEIYLHGIPYMQFPLLLAGRPFTGERAAIPGVPYEPEEKDGLRRQWLAMWRYYQQHPEGPFVYGPWDSFPIWPDVRERHAAWLKRYLPMVEEGSWAYLEISDSVLFSTPVAANTVASVFVNLETYLVLANYGREKAAVETADAYVEHSNTGATPGKQWTLPPRSLLILRKIESIA
jgi:hypothetical protein